MFISGLFIPMLYSILSSSRTLITLPEDHQKVTQALGSLEVSYMNNVYWIQMISHCAIVTRDLWHSVVILCDMWSQGTFTIYLHVNRQGDVSLLSMVLVYLSLCICLSMLDNWLWCMCTALPNSNIRINYYFLSIKKHIILF